LGRLTRHFVEGSAKVVAHRVHAGRGVVALFCVERDDSLPVTWCFCAPLIVAKTTCHSAGEKWLRRGRTRKQRYAELPHWLARPPMLVSIICKLYNL